MTAKDKVIDKIRKMQAHADSAHKIGSENEAEAFAEMIQRLLARHKLDMTDIEFSQMEVEEPVQQHSVDYDKHGMKVSKSRVAWMEGLARIIANAHFCKILVHSGSSRISIIGRKSDADVAEYMIITLQRLIDKMSIKARLTHNNECKREGRLGDIYGFRQSYIKSFVSRIAERYQEAKRSQEGESSTALVRINRAEQAVKDFIDEQYSSRRYQRASIVRGSSKAGNAEGHRRGRAAADAIDLNGKAVKSGNRGRRGQLA